MIEQLNVYTIKKNDKYFFFDGDRLYFVPSTQVINDLLDILMVNPDENLAKVQLASQYNEDELNMALEGIKNYVSNESTLIKFNYDIEKEKWENGNFVQNLWLNISNDCNLRCIYCYGSGGSYGKARKLMTMETAKKCIDFWYKKLDRSVKEAYICFFGGEPFMNKPVFKYCIEYINELLKDTGIKPMYMVTTNGTILDEEYMELIKTNNIRITISMDGGAEITAKNRPNVAGESSYYKIRENLPKFKSCLSHITARVTLTGNNVDKLTDIVEELCDLGFSDVHYEIASVEDEDIGFNEKHLEALFKEIDKLQIRTREKMQNKSKYSLDNLTHYINYIHNRIYSTHCSFYTYQSLMFGTDGEIFKCHRVSSDQSFIYGNVNEGVDSNKFLNASQRQKLVKCEKCIAKNLCSGGCAQVNLTYNRSMTDSYEPYCENERYLVKAAIDIYSDYIMNKAN